MSLGLKTLKSKEYQYQRQQQRTRLNRASESEIRTRQLQIDDIPLMSSQVEKRVYRNLRHEATNNGKSQ